MITFLTVGIMLMVAYAHMREGLFTGLLMFINVMIAGLVAFGFFEPIAAWLEPNFQGGTLAGCEDFLSLLVLFSATFVVLRALTNRLAAEMLDFPANFQYAGALFGLVSGYFLAGFMICAMETLPWEDTFLGFKPRLTNDSGPRSIFPPDRVWLATMRYAGAHSLAWEEDSRGTTGETPYDRYLTFDRYATFELRYRLYRRFNEKGETQTYKGELNREIHR